jgi:hypothetical protein
MYSSTRFPGGKMKYCHVSAGKKSFFTSRDGPPLSSLTQRRSERNVKPESLILSYRKKVMSWQDLWLRRVVAAARETGIPWQRVKAVLV